MGERLRDLTLALYTRAAAIAERRGIILADTKFEFGVRPDGTIVVADEVLTPDSSRFWDAAAWEPGVRQDSFDKQFLRDWLAKESGWDRGGDQPPPALPAADRRRHPRPLPRGVRAPHRRRAAARRRPRIGSRPCPASLSL